MPDTDQGSPEKERPSGYQAARPDQKSLNTTSHHHEAEGCFHDTAHPRLCAGDALRRRRQASYRCEPLASGHRDPWQPCRAEKLSDRQLEGAALAAQHLLDAGMMPLLDIDTLRQLWRAGHHALVDELRDGVAA